MWRQFRKSVAHWIAPTPKSRQRRTTFPQALQRRQPSRQTPYQSTSGAKTWQDIIAMLESGHSLTRKQISERLDVSTAGIHLSAMMREGVVRAEGWPYRYSLVVPPADSQDFTGTG